MQRQKAEQNKRIVEEDRARVNSALKGYMAALKGPPIVMKAMEYAVFGGGKRLRSTLTIESSRVLGGNIKAALPFACAIELVHNFSLVHDDLPGMDNDDTRRGKPACHKKFGEGLAILTGDGLLNLAFGILSRSKHKKALAAMSLLSDAIGVEKMIGGQALDLLYRNRRKKVSKLQSKINSMKTAALMAVSCEIGALAACAGTKDAERMHEFGTNLGCAFQFADDIEDSARNALTLRRMKKEVDILISEAKKCIAPFKERSGVLRYIADSVSEKARKKGNG